MLKSTSIVILMGIVLAGAGTLSRASTIWTGSTINFTHSSGTGELADTLISGAVVLTRGSFGGLYNSATETGANSGSSPDDTEWAVGSLANFNSLSYGACPLEAGNAPPSRVGTTYVVHLINEDIYLSLTLTAWGGQGGGGDKSFSYTRSTPAVAAPPTPTISITNPVAGTVFAAPANVSIAANATVSSGTVTNVQFFTNNVSVGSVAVTPFKLTVGNLAAGAYALKAVATAAGISATSAVINITIVSPPMVGITSPASGAVFAAPANVNISANAAVLGGTVTNVQFFTNNFSLGSVAIAPFKLTATNLAAGSYSLAAVATASGISTTSSVVNISVVNAKAVNLSTPSVNSSQFTFNYSADAGLSYVVQSSTNLLNWVSLVTNVAAGSPVLFTNALNPAGIQFYRVGRLPNP